MHMSMKTKLLGLLYDRSSIIANNIQTEIEDRISYCDIPSSISICWKISQLFSLGFYFRLRLISSSSSGCYLVDMDG